MSCFDGSSAIALTPKSNGPQDIAIIQNMATFEAHHHMFQCSGRETPEIYPHRNMSSFNKRLDISFNAWATLRSSPPIETCKVSGFMFRCDMPMLHAKLGHGPSIVFYIFPLLHHLSFFSSKHSIVMHDQS